MKPRSSGPLVSVLRGHLPCCWGWGWGEVTCVLFLSVQEFMTFTSQLIVERSAKGSRASVKEQGRRTCCLVPALRLSLSALGSPGPPHRCASRGGCQDRAPLKPPASAHACASEPSVASRCASPSACGGRFANQASPPLRWDCVLCSPSFGPGVQKLIVFLLAVVQVFIIQVFCKHREAFLGEAFVTQTTQEGQLCHIDRGKLTLQRPGPRS